jgi:hypothetical protein
MNAIALHAIAFIPVLEFLSRIAGPVRGPSGCRAADGYSRKPLTVSKQVFNGLET